MKIIITSPSLDPNISLAGISGVTQFILNNSSDKNYIHFELGKKDAEKRNLFWFTRILRTYIQWCIVLLRQRKALIHFNVALEKNSIIRDTPLIILARLLRKRMIIHLHGGEFLMHQKMPLWMKWLLKAGLSGNNPKVVLSPLEKDALQSRLGLKNLVVLFNCVDLRDAIEYKRNHRNESCLKLLYLGRITEAKGIEYIYLALETLKEKGVRFKFTMAGKGVDEKKWVPMFQQLLGSDFEFKGVVHGKEKTKVLQDCDVFLLPSFYEGLPLALLEAMSFGLVPVITDVGSISCVIEDGVNGLYVKRKSREDIVTAICKISSDRKIVKSISDNARQHIFENYDPQKYISQLNEIYSYE